MDPFHERLARVALEVTAAYGFALAGGYAVQAHGFLDRPSADVDLFAEASAEFNSRRPSTRSSPPTGETGSTRAPRHAVRPSPG
jgi:hypothetical protein